MKIFLISDNRDTATGLRLAGIPGIVVHEKEEIEKALDDVLADETVGIVVLTEKTAKIAHEKLDYIKDNYPIPLVVVVPDRHGSEEESSIMRYVNNAIGL